MTSIIRINGVTVVAEGNSSVVVSNGKIFVDGKEIKVGNPHNVSIVGSVGELKVSGNVEVKGNVTGSVDAGGSVVCGDVGGSIDAGGSVKAKNAKYNIDAGGSVHVG